VRLAPETARDRFLEARVACLATAGAGGRPHLVPVTFAACRDGEGEALVFAVDHKPKTTSDLIRLANIRANPAVCLLVERWSEDWSQLWWARADAAAEITEDAEFRAAALVALAARYPPYRNRPPEGPVVRIRVERWSGWSGADLGK
jgi:PPOX class probable F420-dependent enzyme